MDRRKVAGVMTWPEALFYSIVTVCVMVCVLYIVERYHQSRGK